MKPLEVFALDRDRNRATGSIPYTHLTWDRCWEKPGQFEMVVPSSVYDKDWAYIYCDERPETGIIQKVQYSDTDYTETGEDEVTVSGFFLEELLNHMTFLVEEAYTYEEDIPAPNNPFTHLYNARHRNIYKDKNGNYYYSNISDATGESKYAIDVKTGDKVALDDASLGLEKQQTLLAGDKLYTSKTKTSNFTFTTVEQQRGAYYTEDGGKTITSVNKFGENPKTHKVEFTIAGDTYYFDEHLDAGESQYDPWTRVETYKPAGTYLYAVSGVSTKKAADEYRTSYQAWLWGPQKRTVTVEGPYQRTKALEPTTERDSVASVMDWVQRFTEDCILVEKTDLKGVTKAIDPSLKYLGDLVYEELNAVDISCRVMYDFETNKTVFSVYKGRDLTQSQSKNPWAVFSDTWGSMYGYDVTRDTSNFKNTIYVLYEYDQPKSFDDMGYPNMEPVYETVEDESGNFVSKLKGWVIPYTTLKGVHRVRVDEDGKVLEEITVESDQLSYLPEGAIETYLDARDTKPDCDKDWERSMYSPDEKPTFTKNMKEIYDRFPQTLKDMGSKELREKYYIVNSIDTGTLDTSGYITEYDLGDIVDLSVDKLGIKRESRINEVSESYGAGTAEITLTLGNEKVSITDKARMV